MLLLNIVTVNYCSIGNSVQYIDRNAVILKQHNHGSGGGGGAHQASHEDHRGDGGKRRGPHAQE